MIRRSLFFSALYSALAFLVACHPQSPAPITPAPSVSKPAIPATARSISTSDDPRETIPFLASDALSGRAPGTPGLVSAGDFLAAHFAALHLQPLPGLKDYFQTFTLPMASSLGPGTNLMVNDHSLVLQNDFSPFAMTGEGPFRGSVVFAGYGITAEKAGYDDYAGIDAHRKIVLAMRTEPRDDKGKSRLAAENQQWSDNAFLNTKAKNAEQHGAVALLLVLPGTGGADQVAPFLGEVGGSSSSIPVIQVSRRTAELLLSSSGSPELNLLQQMIDSSFKPHSLDLHDVEVAGDITLKHSSSEVRNVIAYIPGTGPHADEFVVVGAHYDHLGTGQLGHMLGPVGSIYHGADDNASGTAAILELADEISHSDPLPRSVVFILFTAEEEGLIGSDWFVKHPPIPLDKIVAMLNLDMVGRLKDENLLIGGWGTAPIFDSMVKHAAAGLPLKTQSFEKGGLGPSDHMSFALKKIPVLFLFTGLHADYHRPTDTADKINYPGIDEVVTMSQRIVTSMAAMPRQTYDGSSDSKATMAFTTGHGAGHRAALGIVPDFGSVDAKAGVAISGVSEKSPAEAAGLKGGDIIRTFNDKPMNNLQDLSDALAEANPGDKVTLKIERDGKPLELHAVLGERTN
jgi:hypothetical protein